MNDPQLIVIYDPSGRLSALAQCIRDATGARTAKIDLPDGLEDRDIYEVARKLAELLLEQLG